MGSVLHVRDAPPTLPPPSAEEIAPTHDSLAEEVALGAGLDLHSRKTALELQRLDNKGKIGGHVHRLIVLALWVVGLSSLAMFVTLVIHMILPVDYLPHERLAEIKQMLFSGAAGAILSGLAKKYLGLKDEE